MSLQIDARGLLCPLPVLRLPGADSAVERAFGAGPPLALPGGDAWVAMARQALETEVSPALPARVGIRARRRRQRHQLLLAGGLAFLLFGAAGLGVALLLPEQAPPPLARAEVTNSRSLSASVAARTTRATAVQSNRAMMTTTRQNPAAPERAKSGEKPSFVRSSAPRTISSGSSGSASTPSVTRIRAPSTAPTK